jgi:hypothetical protein
MPTEDEMAAVVKLFFSCIVLPVIGILLLGAFLAGKYL